MTGAAAEIKSKREEPENHVARWERRRRCLPASARLPARKMPAPRGGSAAGAAALMVGTEQRVKADEHDRPHVRLPVLPLALWWAVPTDVHSRCSIATSVPVAFSAQKHSIKGHLVVHSERSRFRLKPSRARRTRIVRVLRAHMPDRCLLSLDCRQSVAYQQWRCSS
jgi:hypothetical protein